MKKFNKLSYALGVFDANAVKLQDIWESEEVKSYYFIAFNPTLNIYRILPTQEATFLSMNLPLPFIYESEEDAEKVINTLSEELLFRVVTAFYGR